MKKNPRNLTLFQKTSLAFLAFFLSLTFLAILGLFYRWFVITLFLTITFIIIYLSFKKIYHGLSSLQKIKKHIIILFIFGLALFHTLLHHDFSLGRDETGYQVAAVKLAQENKLYFQDILTRPFHPFREVEDKGQDTFTSQFLPGYNTYLAMWYILGGIKGMLISNFPLIFIALLSIYKVAQILAKKLVPKFSKISPLFSLLFTASFYPYFWFFRRTNSENLFIACFWLGSLLFIDGLIKKKVLKIASGLLPFTFLILIRGEGIIYLIVYLLLSLISILIIEKQKKIYLYLFYLLPLIGILFHQFYSERLGGSYLGDHLYNLQRTIIKNFFSNPKILLLLIVLGLMGNLLNLATFFILKKRVSLTKISGAFGILTIIISHWILHYYFLNSNHTFPWASIRTSFVFNVFSGYLLLPYLIILALGLLNTKKRITTPKQNFTTLSISPKQKLFFQLKRGGINLLKNLKKDPLSSLFILVLPSFIFLLDPFVALDQPWFLRRFYAVLLPFTFILTGIFIYYLPLKKRYINFIIFLLIGANLLLSSPLLFYREHQGIKQQLENFVKKEKELYNPQKTLYLMSPGWRWQQWAYQLHYLYGLNILPKLDRFSEEDFKNLLKQYEKIFILHTSRKEIFPSPFVKQSNSSRDTPLLYFSDEELKLKREVALSYPQLEITCPLTSYILNDDDEKYDYSRFNEKCFKKVVPSKITTQRTKLYIYELRR